jgi:hypothetical protein
VRRRFWRWAAGGLGLAVAWFAIDYYAYPYGSFTNAPTANWGENGLWLRYTWYFGEKSDDERRELAHRLTDNQIRYAYFHVRFIHRDGSLHFRHAGQARILTAALHREAPGVKLLAYAYAASRKGEGPFVDLTNLTVRKRMASEAAWLVRECGFDGVQWDYEICADGEPGYLDLLRETRAAMGPGKLLSVATPVWYPWPLGRLAWSESYFGAVARECDQMAVMVYDTGFVTPRSYAWLARQQAIHVTRAVARSNPKCRVLLGIPTYGTGFRSHNPRAENIEIALKAVREGMADPAANPQVFAGVTLFADYTTDSSEWASYQRLWLDTPPTR